MEIVTGLLLVLFVTVIARLVLRASEPEPRFDKAAYLADFERRHPQDARQVLLRQASKPISFQRAPRDVITNPYKVTYPNRDISEVVSPFAAQTLGIGSPDDR
jgi:hypothetical protein